MLRDAKAFVIWAGVTGMLTVPVLLAASSEFLAYRSALYIAAGLAGAAGLALLLLQPLLASGLLPGLSRGAGRVWHRWIGGLLGVCIAVHVGGLWITSPPDMIDALTFAAPTLFSAFGVLAMWAFVLAAMLGIYRKRLPLRPQVWRLAHTAAVLVVTVGTIAHALLIVGTMEPFSKLALSAAVATALTVAILKMRPWVGFRRRSRTSGR